MAFTHNKKSPHAHSLAAEHEGINKGLGGNHFFYPCTQGAYWIAPFCLKM